MGVFARSVCYTIVAVVPIWAGLTLVTNAEDCFITTIADGFVTDIVTRSQHRSIGHAQVEVISGFDRDAWPRMLLFNTR
jgi:hypothetical protein